nr:hypothetical protein GCM10020092_072560 [Actinoplanes digitatis]
MTKFNFKLRENRHEIDELVTAEGIATAERVAATLRDEAARRLATFEGAPGFDREPRAELFLLGVSNMVGEDTFYEGAADRDDRFRALVAAVAVADPDWFARFVRWLRTGAMLRSASVVAALEGARAQVAAGIPGSRATVDAALQRADEPGEALAYWLGRYGRALPKPVKRGVADAAVRLYHERSLLKYDTDRSAVRFGDVIELTHPTARDERQGDLFRHALDRRHHRDNPIPASLTTLAARAELMALPVERRGEVGDPAVLGAAGMTWEALARLAADRDGRRRLGGDHPGHGLPGAAAQPAELRPGWRRRRRRRDRRGAAGRPGRGREVACPADAVPVCVQRGAEPAVGVPAGEGVAACARGRAGPGRTDPDPDRHLGLDGQRVQQGRLTALLGRGDGVRPGPGRTRPRRDGGVVLRRQPGVPGGGRASRCWRPCAGSRTAATSSARGPRPSGPCGRTTTVTTGSSSSPTSRRTGTARRTWRRWCPRRSRCSPGTWLSYRVAHTPASGNRHTFGGLSDAAFAMIPLVEAGSRGQWPF